MSTIPTANGARLAPESLLAKLNGWAGGSGPLYRQLADAIEGLIERGELRHGDLLPPERHLATAMSTSRSTVVAAYDRLRRDGRVERRQGSGTRVVGPELAQPVAADFKTAPLFVPGAEIAGLLKAIPERLDGVDEVIRAVTPTLVAAPDVVDPGGIVELRSALAEWYGAQGVPTHPDQIVVTNGAQQAVSLVLSALVRPGDTVLAESWTWPGLSDVVARQGGRCFGVRMDDDGVDTRELRAAVARLRPVAIAVNPHHHNPTATRLLPHRRRELADIAADYGVALLEDRVTAAIAFDGVVPPPLAHHRPDAPISVVDSLSKTVWPGLRIGWTRTTPELAHQLRIAKAVEDQFSAIPSQHLALALLERYDELVARRVEQIRRRADVAMEALAAHLPEWQVTPPRGGLVLWPKLPAPVANAFIHRAARLGVLLAGSDSFTVGVSSNDRVRVPFTAPEAELVAAIERMGAAWRSLDLPSASALAASAEVGGLV